MQHQGCQLPLNIKEEEEAKGARSSHPSTTLACHGDRILSMSNNNGASLTGQCQCRPGFGGRTCTECPDNTYGDPLRGCQPCQCDAEGTFRTFSCDKQTGACLCRPGVTGTRCDSCDVGHCDSFPACEQCPSCFFTLDYQRKNISLVLERLSPRFPSRPGGADVLENFGRRILTIESNLNLIRNFISLPSNIVTQVDDALSKLDKLRGNMDKVNNDLSPMGRLPGLESEVDKLQALMDSLIFIYKDEKDAMEKSISANNAGAFIAIKNAYDESTDSAKKVNASENTVKETADVREEAKDIQNQVQPNNIRDLSKLNHSMASHPDLTPVAKKVCGSVQSEPCTPLLCKRGDLCPPEGATPCKKGTKCVGGLPLSKGANADVKDVKDRLDKLNGKITEASEMLQKTQETAKQVKQSAEKLSSKLEKAKDEIGEDLKETRIVVKELKDFLSDPSSNLTQIQEVSDWILKAKLPLNLAVLKRKLEELKNLAANLPNSTSVLKEAEPQLDDARKLLLEAQAARDVALEVKADVDMLVTKFRAAEGSLSDLEDKLQDKLADIESLNDNLMLSKDQLSPIEKTLDDISTLINPLKPQLDELKDLLKNGGQLAQNAQEKADRAEDEAIAAKEDLLTLEEQLDRLKDEATTEAEPEEERLLKLQADAGVLVNTTENMMKTLEGKADSIRGLQDEILQKSSKLEGLDIKLKDLLQKLRKKAQDFSTCQG